VSKLSVAEFWVSFILMLRFIMPSVIRPSVVMPSVVAPWREWVRTHAST